VKKLVIATIIIFAGGGVTNAGTFSWTPDNTNIIVNPNSLELTVDGITTTVQAFTAEINGSNTDADVLGPWPTTPGDFGFPVFGVDVRQLGVPAGEQLGLIAQQDVGIPANGTDFFSGGFSPGFATNYSSPVNSPSAFHFALFSFDMLVDIPGVTVDDVTNFDRNIWMATGTTVPDFTGGFLSGISAFNVVNSADDFGDGPFTHNLGEIGIKYLLVGAPPIIDFGPLEAGGSQFFIDSFNGTLSLSEPPPAVPLPAALWLFGTALIGLVGFSKRRKAA